MKTTDDTMNPCLVLVWLESTSIIFLLVGGIVMGLPLWLLGNETRILPDLRHKFLT